MAHECRHIWSPPEKVMKPVYCKAGGTLGDHCYEKWYVEEADTPGNTERRIKERCVFEVCLHLFTLSLHSVLFYQSWRYWGLVCCARCSFMSVFISLLFPTFVPCFSVGRSFIDRPGFYFFCLHLSSQVLKCIIFMVKARKIFCCMYIP